MLTNEQQAFRREKLKKDDNKYKLGTWESKGKVRWCNKNDRWRKIRIQTKRKDSSTQLSKQKKKELSSDVKSLCSPYTTK